MKARVVYVDQDVNPGKIKKLDDLYAAYCDYVTICINQMVKDRRVKVLPSDQRPYFPTSNIISSQILKSAQRQAISIIDSWLAGLYGRKLKKLINQQDLDDQKKYELRTIGKYNVTKPGKFGKGVVSQQMTDLYWDWVWNVEISGNPPKIDSSRFPIQLTAETCTFRPVKRAHYFNGWVLVSCLDRGEPVRVPLAFNPYMVDLSKLTKTVMMQKRNGRWSFQFCEKFEDTVFDGSAGRIGVDVGLNVIAATSDGRVYGRDFKPKFNTLYQKVWSIRANRQRQNLPRNSKRLDRLETRLSGMTKTTTGTIANKLVKSFPGHTFVVEDLDLRGCKGQKRFAYRALQKSLSTKAATQVVNPAYTSQACPSCGYVDRANRSGVKFHCRSCGRTSHADVVGAINLAGRSGDKQIKGTDRPSAVKGLLRQRFLDKRTSSSDHPHNAPSTSGRKLTVKGSRARDVRTALNSRS